MKIEIRTQEQVSEMLFHFHLDQAAAHAQSMKNSLPMTKQVKAEFTVVRNTMNRIWRIQDREVQEVRDMFEETSILIGNFMQLFLECTDHELMLETMKQFLPRKENPTDIVVNIQLDEIEISRQLHESQQRHLHATA